MHSNPEARLKYIGELVFLFFFLTFTSSSSPVCIKFWSQNFLPQFDINFIFPHYHLMEDQQGLQDIVGQVWMLNLKSFSLTLFYWILLCMSIINRSVYSRFTPFPVSSLHYLHISQVDIYIYKHTYICFRYNHIHLTE